MSGYFEFLAAILLFMLCFYLSRVILNIVSAWDRADLDASF